MLGFHIDMNMAHYRAEYLRVWLKELARLGYDTVVWEVENSIQWETCPECVAPDAFSKNEFKSLLAECRLHGLEPIPLLQTLGHAEYVLKHDSHAHLRELPGRWDQYCPRNPELLPFLHRWIDEYLELFGPVRHFHIGADETMAIGCCQACKAYADEHGVSRLYIDHINAVARPLLKRNITPIIWGDMVLARGEALDQLPRTTMIFDWRYDIYQGCGRVCIWARGLKRDGEAYTFGEPMVAPDALTAEEQEQYGEYIFPDNPPSAGYEAFHTADYLAAKGFPVVTCPSSSHYGDNVFSPRDKLHRANVFDSLHKGKQDTLRGTVLTSWSVHLFPWELQAAHIAMPSFVVSNPQGSQEDFCRHFASERFGLRSDNFWRMVDLLSGSCLFTATPDLGFDKSCRDVPEDHAVNAIARIRDENRVDTMLATCRERLGQYREGLRIARSLAKDATRGHDLLRVWTLAGRNLVNRAEVSEFLLANADALVGEQALDVESSQRARILLGRLRTVRRDTDQLYESMIRPSRRERMIGYMFGAVEHALSALIEE